jgi:hypothetical protein
MDVLISRDERILHSPSWRYSSHANASDCPLIGQPPGAPAGPTTPLGTGEVVLVTASHGGTDYQNYRADFWNTWRESAGTHGGLAGMVTTCINTAASSHHSGTNVSICGS